SDAARWALRRVRATRVVRRRRPQVLRDGALSQALSVDEHDVLADGIARHPKVVRGEVRIGIADGKATQYGQLRRNAELFAHDLGVARDRDLNAGAKTAGRQREHERLQEHPDAHAVDESELAMHAHDAAKRSTKELPVA